LLPPAVKHAKYNSTAPRAFQDWPDPNSAVERDLAETFAGMKGLIDLVIVAWEVAELSNRDLRWAGCRR